MKRALRNPFVWFALMLLAAEVVAFCASPYHLVPTADQTTRNPSKHRGWPEYLAVEDDERPLVILIANSQGVGGEIADRKKIYPALLGEHLEQRGYRFENWSTGGLRTTELELLTLKAVRRGATHVILALTVNNFDPAKRVDLDFPFSDITLLSGDPALWSGMRDTVLAERIEPEDVAKRTVLLWSDLARSRVAVTDLAAARTPLALHELVLGREVRPGNRMDMLFDPDISPYFPSRDLVQLELKERRESKDRTPMVYREDAVSDRKKTFEDFFPRLRRRLDEGGVGLTWIWNPLAPDSTSPEGRMVRDRFIREASVIVEGAEVSCENMIDAIGQERFVTRGHFDEEGHREFAKMLVELVDREGLDGATP